MQFSHFQAKNRYKRVRSAHKLTSTEIYDQFVESLLFILLIVTLHTVAMMVFESLPMFDAFWLTMTSITTVGYGDFSAKTELGRLSTILLIYIGGISLLAKMVAEYIDFHLEKRDRKIKGLWEWKQMKDHILIINTPNQNSHRFLIRLIEQMRLTPSLANLPIQIVSEQFEHGLPPEVRDMGAVHVHGKAESTGVLEKLGIEKAKFIILIARDYSDSVSDSINFDILDRIDEYHSTAYVLVEVVDDNNRKRFRQNGADSIVRPVRAYPEIITRALEAPGTEQILENLFTHKGDYPQRFEVMIRNMRWGDIATRIIHAGIGIPLAYIDDNKRVCTNPESNEQIHSDALIVLVNEEKNISNDDLAQALRG